MSGTVSRTRGEKESSGAQAAPEKVSIACSNQRAADCPQLPRALSIEAQKTRPHKQEELEIMLTSESKPFSSDHTAVA